jgi:hypothetical protein
MPLSVAQPCQTSGAWSPVPPLCFSTFYSSGTRVKPFSPSALSKDMALSILKPSVNTHEATLCRSGDRFGAARDMQLFQNMSDVHLDRSLTDVEDTADFFVALSRSQYVEHFPFSRRKILIRNPLRQICAHVIGNPDSATGNGADGRNDFFDWSFF